MRRYVLLHGSIEGDYSSDIEIVGGPFTTLEQQEEFLRDLLAGEPHLLDADWSMLDLDDDCIPEITSFSNDYLESLMPEDDDDGLVLHATCGLYTPFGKPCRHCPDVDFPGVGGNS